MASLTRIAVAAAVAVAVLMVAAVIGGAEAQADSRCANGVSRLTVCAPFVVAGNNSAPSSECCSALGEVDRDCLCNTLRVAYQLPSQCQLPSFNCPSSGSKIENRKSKMAAIGPLNHLPSEVRTTL
ncbi:protein MEN-8-like [Neltuma alba]|uniref:protein MEN-8-like n=1 Tax=Neltuma alba TaxID=207710 RepID=UPI0010A319A4|nr:protein MEN-8-like [Prosopis alba]